MTYEIDPTTDQTESPRGANNPFKRVKSVKLGEDRGVSAVERVDSFHQGRLPGEGEGLVLEVDGELDIMEAVKFIRRRVDCIVSVNGSQILLEFQNPKDKARLQSILREWADNQPELARIDITRAA